MYPLLHTCFCLVLTISLLIPPFCHAAYEEYLSHVQEDPALIAAEKNEQTWLMHIGKATNPDNPIGSSGRDIPLSLALAFILPKGWHGSLPEQPKDKTLSWHKNEAWTAVLARLAQRAQLQAHLDWQQKSVRFRQQRAAQNPTQTQQQKTSPSEAVVALKKTGLLKKHEFTANKAPTTTPPLTTKPTQVKPLAKPLTQTTYSMNKAKETSSMQAGQVCLMQGMSAAQAARRLGVVPQNFYRWNALGAKAQLPKGYLVWIKEPPQGTLPLSNIPAASPALQARLTQQQTQQEGQTNATPKKQTKAQAATQPLAAQKEATVAQTSLRAQPTLPSLQTTPQRADNKEALDASLPTPKSMPSNTTQPQASKTMPSAPVARASSRLHSAAKEETLTPTLPLALPLSQDAPYTLMPGTLIAQLVAWCERAGFQLIWQADRDVEIISHVRYQGPFSSALEQLFLDLARSGQPFRVALYQGNSVVEVREE